jgi:hypothetical protein
MTVGAKRMIEIPNPSAVINGASSHDDVYQTRTPLHMWNSGFGQS